MTETAANITVTFQCVKCGTVEEVESVNGPYFGSAYDFCNNCGEPRDGDTDILSVRPAKVPEEVAS